MARCLPVLLALLALTLNPALHAQTAGRQIVSQPLTGRYLILYRDGSIPRSAARDLAASGARLVSQQSRLGVAVAALPAGSDPAAFLATLAAGEGVAAIVADRLVSGDAVASRISPVPSSTASGTVSDSLYNSPQGWAVRLVGGFGESTSPGPWSITRGAGVRIAILDSGVDTAHPDLGPNLVFNLSEINQSASTGLPSTCDDGSPEDQSGHGTWTASLAAGAYGPSTGEVAGVAPEASLLNIKVLERLPASPTAGDPTGCANGEAQGLLSWVLQGIDDALDQHADIISMSLGAVVDVTTGDGAGLQALFNQVTSAAAQQGAILVASAGNDGMGFGTGGNSGRYVELPAQARGVLAVVAATNPACAENFAAGATCAPGPVTLPYYSNFGPALDALAAPGGSYPGGLGLTEPTTESGWITGACSRSGPYACFSLGKQSYVQAIGTSASAPLAAGVAALVRAAHPDWSASAIVNALRSAALPYPSLPVPLITATTILDPAPAASALGLHPPLLIAQPSR